MMKHSVIVVISLCVSCLFCRSAEEGMDEQKRKPLELAIELTDGSLVIGQPKFKTVKVRAPYGKLKIHIKEITSIALNDEPHAGSVSLVNGDRVTGKIGLKSISLKSVMGEINVALTQIEKIDVCPNGFSVAAPQDGLVLYLSMDNSDAMAEDGSSFKHKGLIKNVAFVEKGKRGAACRLDGDNDGIIVSNSAALEVRDAVTVSAWINLKNLDPGGYANEYGYLVNKGQCLDWKPAFSLGYRKNSGAGRVKWGDRKEDVEAVFNVGNRKRGRVFSKTKMKMGEWYHLAGTYDGETIKIYINGAFENQSPFQGEIRSDKAPVLIGGGNLMGTGWGNQFTFNGMADEIRIYNRALSSKEIKQLSIQQ